MCEREKVQGEMVYFVLATSTFTLKLQYDFWLDLM